jgi:hypothetical protein
VDTIKAKAIAWGRAQDLSRKAIVPPAFVHDDVEDEGRLFNRLRWRRSIASFSSPERTTKAWP